MLAVRGEGEPPPPSLGDAGGGSGWGRQARYGTYPPPTLSGLLSLRDPWSTIRRIS
jgi:hypothetical protein